ncbi:MAG: ComEC/Rec2 family competence protein [Mycoplasmataceae bacterium]|nr:ComEC/Rec2 family competence protein [Mycoplasmataceae bacterium]
MLINHCNKTHHLIVPLMLVAILWFAIYANYWYFLLLLIPIIYLLNNHLTLKQILVYALIVIVLVIIGVCCHNINLWQHLGSGLDRLLHFSVRDHVQNYVSNSYDKTTSSFINLILFNIKDYPANTTYYHMKDLSVVYLIVVSGFHISILKRGVTFILRRSPRWANVVNILLITFYCYLLNFAISVTRVLLMFLVGLIFSKKLKNRIDVLAIAGLISVSLAPTCVFNVGFCMSYLCTLVIILIYRLNIHNVLLEKLFISIAATLVSLPFIVYMQQQISLWAIFNSFALSYVFAFVFIYFLMTFWIIWIGVIQHALVVGINFIINASWTSNTVIPISNWPPLISCSYFIVFYLGIIMLQSYKNT